MSLVCAADASMRAPRVLHLVRPQLRGSIGGVDLHVIELAAAQAQLDGCHPEVVALGTVPTFRRRAREAGVAVRDLNVPDALGVLLTGRRTDLVHAHGHQANLIAASLPRRLRRALVITWHGATAPNLRHQLVAMLDRRCMRRATAVISVSEPGAHALQRRVQGVPVLTVPNGVSVPRGEVVGEARRTIRVELGAVAGEVLVGFVGRLSAEKRPDLFVRVAELVARAAPGTRFVMVGGGPLEAVVRRRVGVSPVRDALRLTGVRHDMDHVYAALDVLVVSSDAEGTPRVVIEAQMRGIPVVATAVGGVPGLIIEGSTGFVLPRGRADALAQAVLRLVASRHLRLRLGRAARLHARTQTVEHMALAVQGIYEACLGV